MGKTTVSVDIGGTFTDIIIQKGEEISDFFKVPTTPKEPELGVATGLAEYTDNRAINELVHATTIATNALLGQYGLEIPKIALLTTMGFKDVIEIARQNRPKLYDLFFQRPKSIVPRDMRFEIRERTSGKGEVLERPDMESLSGLVSKMKEENADSIAISFINSYLNPKNEEEVAESLSSRFKYMSVSSQIAPEQREYERTSTTVVNAALMPIVSRYVRRLEQMLTDFGSPDLSIMASSGGLISTDEVYSRPVQIVESGPAAGVIASAEVATLLELDNIISFDMGGTTAKAGTVVNGEVSITSEYEVGGESHHGRMTKGSGYPVRFPFVDLSEVSDGGGTIIWKDDAGAIRIGPISSGADPGPICYGKGGTEPTITDANLVLGIIGEQLLGGKMSLDAKASIRGLSKLGDPYEIAEAALNLADLEMARAIRIVTVERGLDPADFTMMAFGGAGPQHAARIADELGVSRVIVPPRPGLFSALGLLFSDWRFEARSSFPKDPEEEFRRLETNLKEKHSDAEFLRYADCRYRGQGSELTVPVQGTSRQEIEELFKTLHLSTFGFILEREIDIVTVRVFAVIARGKPKLKVDQISNEEPKSRSAIIKGEQVDLKVYARPAMQIGTVVNGPCAIDDYDSTTFVPEGWSASFGKIGEIRMKRGDGQ